MQEQDKEQEQAKESAQEQEPERENKPETEEKPPEKRSKKKLSPLGAIAIALLSSIVVSIVTVQICYRKMYLDTKHEGDVRAAELSQKIEELQSKKDATLSGKFQKICEYFEKYYIGTLDEKTIQDEILKQFIALTGDDYAEYFTAEEYKQATSAASGSGAGIGIFVVQTDDGRMLVSYVEEDSPAKEAKLQALDEIVAVDGKAVSEIGFSEASALLRGKEGSEAVFTVSRDGVTHEYSLTRRTVKYASVRFKMIGKIAYIRILSFNSSTFEECKKAFATAKEQGTEALVFDLRGNGGGTLTAVYQTLDYLIPDGSEEEPRVVVTTTDALDNQRRYLCTDGHGIDLPMAVLTDNATVSAAELFAAALRDYGMAVLVGGKTYGKGVAQSTVTLSDGSAFKLTTATYDPPSGVNFNGVGLLPDVEAGAGGVGYELLPTEEDPVFLAAKEALKK